MSPINSSKVLSSTALRCFLVLTGSALMTMACSSRTPEPLTFVVADTTVDGLPDTGTSVPLSDTGTSLPLSDAGTATSGGVSDGGGGGTTADGAASGVDGGGVTPKPDVTAGGQDTGGGGGGPAPICKTPADCFKHKATPICKVLDGICVQCVTDFHCPKTGETCNKQNQCAPASCIPGAKACIDGFKALCKADGKGWDKAACPDAAPHCINGECKTCIPNEKYCSKPLPGQTQSKIVLKCNASGSDGDLVAQCGGATVCINGKCGMCTPGMKKCNGFKAMVCKADGSGWEVGQDCAAKDLACLGGLCVDPCGKDIKSNTNVGCDYWGVDLDNAQVPCGPVLCDAQNMQYSVIISNTKNTKAEVTITTGAGKSSKYTIGPKDMKVINLPDPAWGGKPLSQQGSGINNKSFRIQSTVPIVAYQFNPLENYKVFSNDASLLLPSNVIGNEYFVMSRQQNFNNLRGYFTVVAASKGKTVVKVLSAAKTLAGIGVVAMVKGKSYSFTLSQGEVLNVETNEIGADLTGSLVTADKPIAVFGGHEGGNVPDTNRCVKPKGQLKGSCEFQGWPCESNGDCPVTCCADHLEEQLLPISAWGTQ